MTKPEELKVGATALYNADHSLPYCREVDGEVVIVRRIDEKRQTFSYWVETVNTINGAWAGTWADRRELRKLPDRKEG